MPSLTLTHKILKNHLLEGNLTIGKNIGIRIDQTLTQDATGTMAYLELESMDIDRVKTETSVAYIDHNTLQTGFENADDHRFIESAAKKYGIYFSRPGNGICHQIHLERFGKPGKILIGSDSHTPTCGGLGMLAMGAGGLDVAVAMSSGAYYITVPRVVGVKLSGKLSANVSAKDIILEMLSRVGVKGGIGKIFEYFGTGVKTLSVPERATITNMGAEMGATTSIFPSDEHTHKFLLAQDREQDYIPMSADEDAEYDEVICIDLREIKPMVACPNSPDNVKTVKELEGLSVDQVCIGSCTNSSYMDLMKVAHILKGKTVHHDVSVVLSPGSKQVYSELARCGALTDLIDAGVRILECACGPCIGMGQAPRSGGTSLRTFNRNFEGRSGTKDASIYLVSPETAAISALTGVLTEPHEYDCAYDVELPEKFHVNDNMIIKPMSVEKAKNVKILYGPNIKPVPLGILLEQSFSSHAVLKVGDDITTDHIMPAGAKILPFRSNIPYMSKFCFSGVDPDFFKRCQKYKSGVIIGGFNYGQGSSREHAALVPLYLGVKVVLAKSFARIHASNLVNAGIIPLEFVNKSDYDKINILDELKFIDIKESLLNGEKITIENLSQNTVVYARTHLSKRQIEIIISGGLLNFTKNLLAR